MALMKPLGGKVFARVLVDAKTLSAILDMQFPGAHALGLYTSRRWREELIETRKEQDNE